VSAQPIFERAAARGEGSLPYAGAVTPQERTSSPPPGAATIVDVRTRTEYDQVGHVEGTPLIEWRRDGEQQPDPKFAERLAASFPRDSALLLICRSGVRSHYAADGGRRRRLYPRLQRPRRLREGLASGRPARGALTTSAAPGRHQVGDAPGERRAARARKKPFPWSAPPTPCTGEGRFGNAVNWSVAGSDRLDPVQRAHGRTW
jgi:rhodanese-related sulfurtransferase